MSNSVYIKVEKYIQQPIEKVWAQLATNFGAVSNYNPAIKKSNFLSDKRSEIGTQRHCDFASKGWIEEEIIEWNNLESFKLKLTKSSMPMKFMESKFTVQFTTQGTKVTQEFWYRMKAPMGWMSGIMKGKMQSTLEKGLIGLGDYMKSDT